MTEPYYDPYDATIDADPHPAWKRLRDDAPVYHNERYDFWALSRYDDVLGALLDWETFISSRGILLEAIDTRSDLPDDGQVAGVRPMLIMTDPPRHDRLRKLVSRAFTPRRVASLEPRLRELCAEFLDPFMGGELDYVEDFGAKVPSMMIGELMGVPAADQDALRIWIDDAMRYDESGTDPTRLESLGRIEEYLQALVADRRREPRDDMTSDLLAATVELDDGRHSELTHDEVMGFVQLLIFAGTETTARLIGWTGLLLARHPDQRELLVDDPGLVPNAIEEILRYEAPSPIQGRYVARDVTLHGVTIPRGARLALLNGAADRDERAFPDPDRFDVRRTIDRHLAFGYGVHFCLGAALARLEGRVALEETLARFPTWEVDEDRMEFVRTSTVRGPSHLPFRG